MRIILLSPSGLELRGNGVDFENIADVYYCEDANPEIGENLFVCHSDVFGTSSRRLDGNDWVRVRSGIKLFHYSV